MILLTGATGAVGLHVATALAHRPDLRALAHSDRSAVVLERLGVRQIVRGDLSSPPAGLYDDVHALFLLMPGLPDQVAQEIGAIDGAVAAGVQRIVKLSAREVALAGGEHFTERVAGIERHLRSAPLASAILRPDHFMSNLLMQRGELNAGRVVFPCGPGALAWIDPRDIAAVVVEALTCEQPLDETLTLTGPEVLTFPELAAVLSEAVGRQLRFVDEPPAAWRERMARAGLPASLVTMLGEMYASIASRPAPAVTGGVDRILGRPPVSLSAWAREVLAPLIHAPAAG